MNIVSCYLPKDPFWGFGDFLRGSFSIAGLCKKFGLPWEINYSLHPINAYLKNMHSSEPIYAHDHVNIFHMEDGIQLLGTLQYLSLPETAQTITPQNCYVSSNCWELSDGISEETRCRVIESLVPSEPLSEAIAASMRTMNVQEGNYRVVHIRMGDAFLVPTKPREPAQDEALYAKIYEKLQAILEPSEQPTIVISDDVGIKRYLEKVAGFIASPASPCHLSIEEDSRKVLETLVDFFLIARASHIYQHSQHAYGAGFSDWCSELFAVPISRTNEKVCMYVHESEDAAADAVAATA
jgi:hypothetical protein